MLFLKTLNFHVVAKFHCPLKIPFRCAIMPGVIGTRVLLSLSRFVLQSSAVRLSFFTVLTNHHLFLDSDCRIFQDPEHHIFQINTLRTYCLRLWMLS